MHSHDHSHDHGHSHSHEHGHSHEHHHEKPNGFVIKYAVENVPGKGKGIVAKQKVPKGSLVWSGKSLQVQHRHTEEQVRKRLEGMSLEEKEFFLNHVYCYGGFCNELLDDSKFTNHSRKPVLCTASRLRELGIAIVDFGREPDDQTDCFAVRDVDIGEEITDDYGEYENPEYYVNLCKQYGVEWAGKVAELYE